MNLTQENISSLFNKFKCKAKKYLARGRYDCCLRFLKAACRTAYTFYIGFTDQEIEEELKQLSGKVKEKALTAQKPRCVFYDTFSQDTQGLSMQYVDAIIAAGWEMLYITEFGLEDPRSVRLKQTLSGYEKSTALAVPRNMKGMKKVQFVYDVIMDYSPDKLFMHIHPDAVEAVTAFYALPKEITRYQINLTDHTYWAGAGCVDYSFEFREYGASLSVERRGLPKDRVFLLPYYPMMKTKRFEEFPQEVEGKVKIFSGASFYKIIDENDTFFKLNKAILDANPNAVTLFAGGGDLAMLNGFIEKYELRGRFIPIGQRNDIYECYKHSDIYLSSYPLGGGLMAQYAAHASLPILALANPASSGKIEEMVCQKKAVDITFNRMEDLVVEATKLVNDENYRKSRGQEIRACVIDEEEFNHSFKMCITNIQTAYPVLIDKKFKLHYLNIDDKLKLENRTHNYHKMIFTTLALCGLFVCPMVIVKGVLARLK